MRRWINKPPLGTPLRSGHPQLHGLVGWWLFQEGAGGLVNDLSGNGNAGVLSGFAFPSTPTSGWNPGRAGRTLTYDGINDFGEVPAAAILNRLSSITVSLWMRGASGGDQRIASNRALGAPNNGWFIAYDDSDNQIQFFVDSSAGIDKAGFDIAIVDNQWHHVVGTWDGATIRVFVDGIEGTPVGLGGTIGQSQVIRFGRGVQASASYYQGLLDDVRIFSRALTRSEIQDIMIHPFAAFASTRVALLRVAPVEPYVPDLYNFTLIQKKKFIDRSLARVRHPTFSLFLERHGDVTADGLSADYRRRVEDTLKEPNYGTGTITLSDESEKYIEGGRSVFRNGDKVMLFGGFDDLNIPLFSGLIRDVQVQASAKVTTLQIADQGYRLRVSKTSGDFSSYPTPKTLINYLVSLARIGAVVYENESGPPTTFTFGDTFLELRSFWAMIHGAALCISYIQHFDEQGKLHISRRTTFAETGYIFTDSEITRLKHFELAELINHKTIDYVHCIRPEFTAGDGIHPGQHTRSRTDSTSKHKYGEYEDQETDELIGTWTNAGKMIDQILDFYPFPMHIYQMDTPALPQLQIADRIFISSDETGIEGFFWVTGEAEQINTAGYNGQYTLLSAGELF